MLPTVAQYFVTGQGEGDNLLRVNGSHHETIAAVSQFMVARSVTFVALRVNSSC